MADEAEDEQKKSNLVPILLAAVGGLLLIVIGLGVGYFLFGGNSSDPSTEVEQIIERQEGSRAQSPEADDAAAEEEPSDVELDENGNPIPKKMTKDVPDVETFVTTYYEFTGNMTTNLKNSRKFLQLGIGVATQYDEEVMANVDTHQVALRSEILTVMSEFTEQDISGREGKEKLSTAILNGLNARLEELEGFGGVERVHFTSFVLQ